MQRSRATVDGIDVDLRIVLAALAAPAVGCLELDPEHCANVGGDAACGEGAFCSLCVEALDGCVDVRPAAECAPEDEASVSPEPAPEPADAETSPPSACGDDGECPADVPYCVAGQCRGCVELGDDAFCRGSGEGSVCTPWGRCGGCDPTGPEVCAPPAEHCGADFECGGCSEHAQCAPAGCDRSTGRCLPAERVWWVDPTGCAADGGFGTPDDPYCGLAAALANVPDAGAGTIWLQGGGSALAERFAVHGSGRRIALLGAGEPVLAPDGPAIVAGGGTRVLVEGVQIMGTTGTVGVACREAGVWLDGVVVHGGDVGVSSLACELGVRRSRLHAAERTALELTAGSHLVLENSTVTGVGTFASTGAALELHDSVADVRFSTLVADASAGSTVLRCDDTSAVTAHSAIVAGVRSSTVACGDVDHDYSWIDAPGTVGRGSHLGPIEAGWFSDLPAGDAHLSAVGIGVLAGTGQWTVGDPLVDLDGDARPGVHLRPDFPGADRP